jgi:hypothetical protein
LIDTGLDVLATDSVHVVATGTIQLVPGDQGSVVGPDGEPGRYGGCDLGLWCGTLIASLQPTRGWVRAGSEALLSFRATGRLYLRVNAADPGRVAGSFSVAVRAGRQDVLGVVTPSPAGISRDAVLPGDGGIGLVGGAPALDLGIGAAIAGLGAVVGLLAARRFGSRRKPAPPAVTTTTAADGPS